MDSLLYADDIILIQQNEDDLQRAMFQLQEVTRDYTLTISVLNIYMADNYIFIVHKYIQKHIYLGISSFHSSLYFSFSLVSNLSKCCLLYTSRCV